MKDSMSLLVQDPVETLRQARIFDSTKRHYERLGLCRICAAQAAWGHQLGFSRVTKQPCRECQPFVDRFPRARPGKWRSYSPRSGAKFSLGVRPDMSQ
jgi:hypothetical protein